MATLASLVVDFKARTATFERDMKSVRKTIDGFQSSIHSAAKAAGVLAVAYAGFKAFTFFKDQFLDIANFADELIKTAGVLGTTTEELSKLKHVSDLNGVSFDLLTNSLQKQTKFIGEAAIKGGEQAKALNEMGLSAERLASMNIDEQFDTISKALIGMSSETDRVRIAMTVWGRSGADMLRIVNQGTAAIEAQKKQAEELGIVISSKTAHEFEVFNDTLSILGAAFRGVGIAFLSEFTVPMIRGLQATAEMLDDVTKRFTVLGKLTGAIDLTAQEQGVKTLTEIYNDQIALQERLQYSLEYFEKRSGGTRFKNQLETLRLQIANVAQVIGILKHAIDSAALQDLQTPFGAAAKAIDEMLNDLEKNAGKTPKKIDVPIAIVFKDVTDDMNAHVELYKEMGGYIERMAEQHEGVLAMLDQEKNKLEEMGNPDSAYLTNMEKAAIRLNASLEKTDVVIANVASTFRHDLAQGIFDSVAGVQQFGDVVRNVAVKAVEDLIVSFIEMGIQKILLSTLFKSTLATDVAATASGMAVISAAAAPAAAGTAIATAGASAVTGGAALASTYGLAQVLGAFKTGSDYLPQTGLALVHEAERIVQPEANRDLTAFLRDERSGRRGDTFIEGDTYNITVPLTISAPDTQTGAEFLMRHRNVIGSLAAEAIRRNL